MNPGVEGSRLPLSRFSGSACKIKQSLRPGWERARPDHSRIAMRTSRARQAALLLGLGLGAFFEGTLFHPVAGPFYLVAWVVTVSGVLLLWWTVRGPGPLPSGRAFIGNYLFGWGLFNMVDGLLRHDLANEWPVFATGVGFVFLGFVLSRMRDEHIIERRSGYDRRSDSPVR
jgi:uncharacterized membrane protein